jgi:hypothetical protein
MDLRLLVCTSGCSLHIGTSHPPCLSRRSDFQADGGLFIPAELLTEADKFMTDLVRHIAVDEVTHVRPIFEQVVGGWVGTEARRGSADSQEVVVQSLYRVHHCCR